MATILPFPLASRRVMIEKQARYAAELNPDAAERHIQQQLKVQADSMRRRGVDEDIIARELRCMETAIRSALCRASMGLGGRT
ncbi:DUF6074 family protein [Afipia felis]|uniref:Uncharacterized protein n=2 Tax=Afipia felis TaxID=1035 RepID=A0A380W7K6_AFIFE|nr:DUF6074 family protein [Afipia felis]EKS28155.1 hypothetical protein HMPREF9697_00683 [Afipia felis ATCC 53690]SUU76865.1 Uncharacterised protein [Afipia felis]SUU84931.1 Uncharacterised protein [Afipia felis]